MEFIRVFQTLTKTLKEVPDEILLMIMEVYTTPENIGKCPECGDEREESLSKNKRKIRNYKAYLQNSKKIFGEKNWPFCMNCWTNMFEKCPKCWMPSCNSLVLLSTTVVEHDREEDSECLMCSKSEKYHIKHILGYDPDEESNFEWDSDEE